MKKRKGKETKPDPSPTSDEAAGRPKADTVIVADGAAGIAKMKARLAALLRTTARPNT